MFIIGYKNVRHYRHTVHMYLDAIWMMSSSKRKARSSMYVWLGTQMQLDPQATHVAKFTRAQCQQAIKILRPKYIQLFGHDLEYERKLKIMKSYATRTISFETAHLLPKRGNIYDGLYSRSYRLKVTVEGPQNKESGMIIPYEVLEEALKAIVPDRKFIFYTEDPISKEICEILQKYDIPYIELPYLVTSENLIEYLKENLIKYLHEELEYNEIKIAEMELFSLDNTCSVRKIY